MLGRFVVKFLYMVFLCCLVQNGQCADDPSHATPQRSAAMPAAVSDPTPGRRVLEEQAKHLKKENFTGLLDEATVDSWGVGWAVFADQTLPFDHPDKRLNINKLLGRLKDLAKTRSDDAFNGLYGSVLVLKSQIGAVHEDRLERLTREYFSSDAFPIRSAYVKGYDVKVAGIQLGGIATVVLPGGQEVRYYVKTHGGGRLASHSSAAKQVNPVELMVYNVLALSGFGCPVHFFQRSAEDVYIATLDAAIESRTLQSGQFLTFEQYREPKSPEAKAMAGRLRSLWESLEAIPMPCSDADKLAIEARVAGDSQAQNFIGQIAALDILSRVLRLTDMFNNPDNFGFALHGSGFPRLRVLDFRVLGEGEFKIEHEHYRGFLAGNGHFNYAVAHKLLSYTLHYRDVGNRSLTARQALSTGGPLVELGDIITQAYADVARYIAHPDFAAHRGGLMAMLDDYRVATLHNLGHFNATLNHDGAHDRAQCFECERARKLSEPC
jgi:hypothetical protein